MLNPFLAIIFGIFSIYASEHGLPVNITCLTEDVPGRQAPETHREGRAVDISAVGWSPFHRERVKFLLNKQFGRIWGTKAYDSTGKTKVIIWHGDDLHAHLQVRRNLKLHDYIALLSTE